MSLVDRFAIGVVKWVLVVCAFWAGTVMKDGHAYLAAVGLLAFAAMRWAVPPLRPSRSSEPRSPEGCS
jgi:hypothetical protein